MKTYDKKTSVFVNLSRLYEDSENMMFYDILDHIVEICNDKQDNIELYLSLIHI